MCRKLTKNLYLTHLGELPVIDHMPVIDQKHIYVLKTRINVLIKYF